MTRHEAPTMGIRSVLRWLPLIIVPAVIAAAAAFWSVSHQTPSYTAVTRLAVVPLAQWDETFLGTSLLRDGGDAKTTASTTAELLNSRRSATTAAAGMANGWTPEAVDRMIQVSAVPDTNVIEIAAQSPDPKEAQRVSEDFTRAVLAERWRTISAELDARIAAISVTTVPDPNAGEASVRLQTLNLIRQAGADPTLRIESTSAAVEDPRLPMTVVLALAALGGSVVGLLCALAAARLGRRHPVRSERDALVAERDSGPTPAYAPDGAA